MKISIYRQIFILVSILPAISHSQGETRDIVLLSAGSGSVNQSPIKKASLFSQTYSYPGKFPSCKPVTLNSSQTPKHIFHIAEVQSIAPEPQPTLRSLAEERGLFIGAAVTPWLFADEFYARQFSQQFNMIAAENAMKWEVVHPGPNRYDFSQGDALVRFAEKYDMSVFAHNLVWDLQIPSWVSESERSRSEWIHLLCTHIKTVVYHYRGQVYAWVVVNEIINEDGTLGNSFWMRKIGPEHIAMAFQWAHEADPNAVLFYNDNGGEGMNRRSQGIYMLVKSLRKAGIPIHGVGLQMHTSIYQLPSLIDLTNNIKRLRDLGFEVQITEMDVRLQYVDEPEDIELAAQAETFRQAMHACIAVDNCKGLTTWGLNDAFSWIPGWTGNPDAPLLFDEQSNPKPAYFAIQGALSAP